MQMSGRERSKPLRPARSRLREVLDALDAVADSIVVIDEAGDIVGLNAAAQEMLDTTAEEAVGQPLKRSMPGLAKLLPATRMLERSLTQGGLDAEVRSGDQPSIPVHVTIRESSADGFAHYVLAVRDFRAVQHARDRMLETEKLAAIGATMTALAHESRNVLQRMQSCLALLRLRSNGGDQELMDDMEEAQDQLRQLYEGVSTFAAPLHLKRRKVDVPKLLEKTWRQLKSQWEPKQIGFHSLENENLDGVLDADPARLGEVFAHVLENAVHASPAGSIVDVRLGNADRGAPGLVITIQDDGPGIPPEQRPRAFDLLYSTKHGCKGMGLAIARRIVREHGGQITIDDTDRGARVRIFLPRETASPTWT